MSPDNDAQRWGSLPHPVGLEFYPTTSGIANSIPVPPAVPHSQRTYRTRGVKFRHALPLWYSDDTIAAATFVSGESRFARSIRSNICISGRVNTVNIQHAVF